MLHAATALALMLSPLPALCATPEEAKEYLDATADKQVQLNKSIKQNAEIKKLKNLVYCWGFLRPSIDTKNYHYEYLWSDLTSLSLHNSCIRSDDNVGDDLRCWLSFLEKVEGFRKEFGDEGVCISACLWLCFSVHSRKGKNT